MNVFGYEVSTRGVLIALGVLGLIAVSLWLHSQAIGWGMPPASTQPCMVCH